MSLTASARRRHVSSSQVAYKCANMTSSTKPEIRNVSEEDRATAIGDMHENLAKIGRAVSEIWSRTDKHTLRQTEGHAHRNTRRSAVGGRSNHRLCCIILYRARAANGRGGNTGDGVLETGCCNRAGSSSSSSSQRSARASLRRSSLTRTDCSAVAVAPSIDAERRGRALRRSLSLSETVSRPAEPLDAIVSTGTERLAAALSFSR